MDSTSLVRVGLVLGGCAAFGVVLDVAGGGLLVAIPLGLGLGLLSGYLHWKGGERITRSLLMASTSDTQTNRRLAFR